MFLLTLYLKTFQLHYVVELDNGGTVVVPRKRICMTQDQIRLCHDSIVVSQLFSPATCSVSMDNIVSGKRRRVIHAEALLASPARTPMSPKSRSETPSGKFCKNYRPKYI